MTLRDLEYLVALADTRHFGRAAARCHVSQPTLSAQVMMLEAYLGTPLVERRPRRIALTAAGESVVLHARRMRFAHPITGVELIVEREPPWRDADLPLLQRRSSDAKRRRR
jgi:hypothetical protein